MRTSWFVIALLTAGSLSAADLSHSLALVYDDGDGHTLPYRLFLPEGYDEPGASFPLVLFLHGAGERGNDNLAQVNAHIDGLIAATQSEPFASFLLAPQVPSGQGWSNFGSESLAPSMELTVEIIALLESQYAIDPARRYVTGLSMGGFGTFDVIAKRPDLFDAAVPMSGGGDLSRAADMVGVRTWTFHGRADATVSVYNSRYMVQAISDAGGDPIYTETGGGHGIWPPIYTDAYGELYPWMFEGTPPPLAELIYNSNNGNLKMDADLAPGGDIYSFTLRAAGLGIPAVDEINGVPVQAVSGLIGYRSTAGAGFGGVVDLGDVLPPGMNFLTLHETFLTFSYNSTATGSTLRYFRLRVVVPEPSSLVLVAWGTLGLASNRLRRRAVTPTRQARQSLPIPARL